MKMRPTGERLRTMSEIEFSVLIGRVSTEDSFRVVEILLALRRQERSPTHEILIVDRLQDAVTDVIRRDHPEVALYPCAANTTLPAMRRLALERASGQFVIVTEDHCVPADDWLASFQDAINSAPADAAAFGGCVENGVHDTAFDWATFLCEYSNSMSPRPNGYATDIPGMNVAYRREALASIPSAQLDGGFWETTLHPELERRNQRLYSSNSIKIYHCKKFSLRLFCRQRFVYSRYYAGSRFPSTARFTRMTSALLSLALPPVLLWRVTCTVLAKNRLRRELLLAFPYLLLFSVIWAAGDIAGYVFGSGDALLEIE